MQTHYSNTFNQDISLQQLFSLNGRTALVVGGAGLLGSEISHALAEVGANIIIASRDVIKTASFGEKLQAAFPNIKVDTFPIDITQPDSIAACIESVKMLTPDGLDILVNSGWSGRKNTFESISDADWNLDIEVCLSGVFRTIKAAFPIMKKQKSNILNIASMYGHVAPDYRMYDSEKFANPPSYGAAKAGIIQLTKYLASFLAPHGIRANAISPGPFPYESTQKDNPEFIQRLGAKNPSNRIGKPYELKGAAVLLCSDAGSYINGQNICIDGGWAAW